MTENTPLKEFVKTTVNNLVSYEWAAAAKNSEKIAGHLEIINKNYQKMATVILQKEPVEGNITPEQLVSCILDTDLIMIGLTIFPSLPNDERKLFTHIFSGSLALSLDAPPNSSYSIVKYLVNNEEALDILLHFYDHPELAVSAGQMLRACLLHEQLAALLLKDARLDILFSYFNSSHFDVSSDSFTTFKELLLSSPHAEEFVDSRSETIVSELHSLIDENNYTTCIQVLQLIGLLLMTYVNFQVFYLSSEKNLMLMMKLMVSNYKTIAKEAYHVFKLFVVFEPKPQLVEKLLKNNADKLIPFISSIITEEDDEETRAESEEVIAVLEDIKYL